MESIIKNDKKDTCYLCHRKYNWIECHHIFGGKNRKLSEFYGLKVHLCHFCHNEPPHGVHHNSHNMLLLHQKGQREAMRYYKWDIDKFREIFGKNYI